MVKGEVFAYDKSVKCLIVSEPAEGLAKCNIRILKTDFIKVMTYFEDNLLQLLRDLVIHSPRLVWYTEYCLLQSA